MLRRSLLTFSALLLCGAALHAECFTLTAKYVMSEPTIELVFAGRLVKRVQVGDGVSRVTLDVERVWKGSAPARVDLYVADFLAERPRFTEGTSSLVLAGRFKNPELRKTAGLSRTATPTELEALGCTGAQEPDMVTKLGPSHPPTSK